MAVVVVVYAMGKVGRKTETFRKQKIFALAPLLIGAGLEATTVWTRSLKI